MTYTNEERAAALGQLALNGGAVRRTARQVGIPEATIRLWRDEANASGAMLPSSHPNAPADWSEVTRLMKETITEGVAILRGKLPTMGGRDVAIAIGILSDKTLDFTVGRKGMELNVDARSQSLTVPPGTTLEDLVSLRDDLKALQALDPGQESMRSLVSRVH